MWNLVHVHGNTQGLWIAMKGSLQKENIKNIGSIATCSIPVFAVLFWGALYKEGS